MKNIATLTISPSAWDAVQMRVEQMSEDPSETIAESPRLTAALDDTLSKLYARKRLRRPIELDADLAFEIADECEHRLDMIEVDRTNPRSPIDPACYSGKEDLESLKKERRGLLEFLHNLYALRGTFEA